MNNRFSRGKKGSSLIELACGLLIVVPIILVLFDLCVIVLAVQVNDATCREAARVAASGPPADANTRAMAIIDKANGQKSSMLSNFTLISCSSTITTAMVTALGTYGGPLSGTVTVTTEVQVTPFVVQYAYNGGSKLTFRSMQSFPCTYVIPNTTWEPTLKYSYSNCA